ncbi:MAG: helix-turn-helix domain-containing protein, partial [Thiohalocapsa sp.]
VDAMRELMAKLGVEPDTARTIAGEVRLRLSGENYIRARDTLETHEVIREGITSREPPKQIAKRAGVSARTVRRRRSRWL